MPLETRRRFLQEMLSAGMAVTTVSLAGQVGASSDASADSDSIPTPEPRVARFERLAYGMFIHWGIYSQLGRGEWVMNREKIPKGEYQKLRDTFAIFRPKL